MSVRQDKYQLILEFINEESKSLARHVVDAENLNKEIRKLNDEEKKLAKEFEAAAKAGKDTLDIETRRAAVQQQINERLTDVLKTGAKIEDLDLSKVVPAQLVSTAKELAKAMEFIPQSHPTYQKLETALKRVNDQLAENRTKTKGVVIAMNEVHTEGGKVGRVMEIVFGVTMASVLDSALNKLKEWGWQLYQRSKDLEFVGNKSKWVFGQMSNDVQNFAQRMTTIVGQSKDQVMKELTDISNSFTTLEFNKTDVANLTKQMYDLSAAWANYNGGKYTAIEVADKFKVALGGEVDELAELGIVMTDDTLKKELAKKGYDKLTGAAYDQAAALTLMEIITRKTKEAQLQLGNSGDTLHAKQNRVTAFLQTTWDNTAKSLTSVFGRIVGGMVGIVDKVAEPQETLIQQTEKLQFAFNQDLAVIEKANIPVDERNRLINKLNQEYKDYLPNLLQENATQADINKVREAGNKLFKEQLFYIAFKQKLTEIEQKGAGATKQILDAEMKDQKDAYEKSKQFEHGYAQMYENRKKMNDLLKTTGKAAVDEAEKERQGLESTMHKLAKQFGKTWEEIQAKWGDKPPIKPNIKLEYDPAAAKKAADDAAKEAAKRLKEQFEILAKEDEIQWKARQVVLENALLNRAITEGDFAKRELEIQATHYANQAKIQQDYLSQLKAGTQEYVDTQVRILDFEKKLAETRQQLNRPASTETAALPTRNTEGVSRHKTGSRLEELAHEQHIEVERLHEHFAQLLTSEIEFENRKAELRAEYARRAYEAALQTGEVEKGQLAKLQKEKIDADNDYHDTLRKNEKRTADLKYELEQTKLGIASDALGVAIELMSRDEAARKKNATAIKTFQVAQITIDGISEVAAIWKNANSNPINALIPGAGIAIATAQTIVAALRTGAAISKVNSAKFAAGGYTGFGFGAADETGEVPAGIVHRGEWVAPRTMVEQYPDVFRNLEAARLRGYATGGIVDLPLLPNPKLVIPNYALSLVTGGLSADLGRIGGGLNPPQNPSFDGLLAAFDGLRADMNNWQKSLKTDFSYTNFKEFESRIETDFNNSSL